jgi:hypothetical protein
MTLNGEPGNRGMPLRRLARNLTDLNDGFFAASAI